MTDPAEYDLRAQLRALASDGARAHFVEPGGGERLLCATTPRAGDLLDQLDHALAELRELSSRDAVRALGVDRGFRIEDMLEIVARVPAGADAGRVEAWLARRLPEHTRRTIDAGGDAGGAAGGALVLAAAFASRVGHAPSWTRYALEDGRLRVEAFELHVTEHCNLRCSSCCNISPLVAERAMTVAEVEAMCARMARVLVADVFKIMGGEPLLHPDVAGVLRAVRQTGIGDRVRLFTNGLLLKSMPDAFWRELDELTISTYASAPVPRATLELARRRSREHGFVLNVKPVSEFSHVVSPGFRHDAAAVRATYERCWLRHRCLIVREGRFYMCTRAAYASDFLDRVAHEPVPEGFTLDRDGDGVPLGDLDGPELAARLEAYMNRTEPLGACRYCFGGDGATEPHVQLTRGDVARGILTRRLTEASWTRD